MKTTLQAPFCVLYRRQPGLLALLLCSLNSLSILARNDFNTLRANHLVGLHLECGILDNEGPDVVA